MEILVQDCSSIQLLGMASKHFMIFSLKKHGHIQKSKKNKFQDLYETFLLIKALPNKAKENNVVFVRNEKYSWKDVNKKMQTYQNYTQSDSYYGTFLRHINLSYCKKLTQLIEILGINSNVYKLQNQWLMLYQVHNFKSKLETTKIMYQQSPQYGKPVNIISYALKSDSTSADPEAQVKYQTITQAIVCNLFRHNNQNFYFLQNENSSLASLQNYDSHLNIVSSSHFETKKQFDQQKLYGLTYILNKQLTVCIPFHSILYQSACQIKICKEIMPKVLRTCYVQYKRTYCTGILIAQNKIISTRHVLPKADQRIGVPVFVRKFPYNRKLNGTIAKIGMLKFDYIEIQIEIKQKVSHNVQQKSISLQSNDNKSYFQWKKNKINPQADRLGFLKINLNENKQNITESEFLNTQSKKSLSSQQKTQSLCKLEQSIVDRQSCKMGQKIVSLGFGKFSFSSNIFYHLQMALPTIASGIISKVIKFRDEQLFIKTDAKLYAGFSGSAIWKQKQNVVGMAVFILKNKNNSQLYNRHSFSYIMKFIQRETSKDNSKQLTLTPQLNQQIAMLDKVHTNTKFNFIRFPKPKL